MKSFRFRHPALKLLYGLFITALFSSAAGCGWATRTTESVAAYFASTDTHLIKRIVLIPPQTAMKELAPQAQAWSKGFLAELKKAPGVTLVGFEELDKAVAKLPNTIRNNEEKVIMAGRLIGVNAVVAGQVVDISLHDRLTGMIGFREHTTFLGLEAELRIFDVATGTVLAQTNLRPEKELDALLAENLRLGQKPPAELVDKLTSELIKQSLVWAGREISAQPWAGYVLEEDGKKALVTVGEDTGLGVGSDLTVYGRGQKVRSGAGTILYVPGPPAAKLRLTEINKRTAWAEILPYGDNKEATVQKGMVIRSN